MSDAISPLADEAEVAAILATVASLYALPDRLEAISAAFEGRPYLAFSLIGGPTEAEQRVTRLDGFDCVTFAESVVALATSAEPSDFPLRLQALRYHRGRLTWIDRNHYMNRWIERNERAGLVRELLPEHHVQPGTLRELSVLPGYPTQQWRLRYLPTEAVPALEGAAQPGDVVAFLSDRDDLDTFHVGLLMPAEGAPLGLRHAGRSAGRVVHEPIEVFLDRNAVSGLLVARPLPLVPPRSE